MEGTAVKELNLEELLGGLPKKTRVITVHYMASVGRTDVEIPRHFLEEAYNSLLRRDYESAMTVAKLLGLHPKVIKNHERNGRWSDAFTYAKDNGLVDEAFRICEIGGEFTWAANYASKLGMTEKAKKYWLKASKKEEIGCRYPRAAEYAQRAGMPMRVKRLFKKEVRKYHINRSSGITTGGYAAHAAHYALEAGMLEEAIEILVNDGSYEAAGKLLESNGRKEEAIEMYEKQIETHADIESYPSAALLCETIGKHKEAKKFWLKDMRLSEKRADFSSAAIAAEKAGYFSKAETYRKLYNLMYGIQET